MNPKLPIRLPLLSCSALGDLPGASWQPEGEKCGAKAGGDLLTLNKWRGTRTARMVFWAGAALALAMAAMSNPPQLPGEAYKAPHIAAFATLTGLGCFAYPRTGLIKLLIGLSLFGALIEIVQAMPFVHRDADVLDWVIDTTAVIIVLLSVAAWRARRQ